MFGLTNYLFGSSSSSTSSQASTTSTSSENTILPVATNSRFKIMRLFPEDGDLQQVSQQMAENFAKTFASNYEEGYLPEVHATTWEVTFTPKAEGFLSWFGQSIFRKANESFPTSTLGLFADKSQELLFCSTEKEDKKSEKNTYLNLFENSINNITNCIYESYAARAERQEELKKRLAALEEIREKATQKPEIYLFTPYKLCQYVITRCKLLKTQQYRKNLESFLDKQNRTSEMATAQKALRATKCLKILFSEFQKIHSIEENKESIENILNLLEKKTDQNQDKKEKNTDILILWRTYCLSERDKYINKETTYSLRLSNIWDKVLKKIDELINFEIDLSSSSNRDYDQILTSLNRLGFSFDVGSKKVMWDGLFEDKNQAVKSAPNRAELDQIYEKQKEEKAKKAEQEKLKSIGGFSDEFKQKVENIVLKGGNEALQQLKKIRDENKINFHQRLYITSHINMIKAASENQSREPTNQSGWETYADTEQDKTLEEHPIDLPKTTKQQTPSSNQPFHPTSIKDETTAFTQPPQEQISEKSQTPSSTEAEPSFAEWLAKRRFLIADSVTATSEAENLDMSFDEKRSFFESKTK